MGWSGDNTQDRSESTTTKSERIFASVEITTRRACLICLLYLEGAWIEK
jgi:hypothetical protein